ncbi:MAG TPA: pyridoxamine 5'-phosphate oxidase family protein, partial [Planctomycetota bacterium]|nr:pyridoxamine 5'-phosphate oxidase family protein [Planctomycetota bacterium]
LDLIRANPSVCFAVAKQLAPVQPHEARDACHLDSDSVICFGTARIIDDLDERADALNAFNRFYRPKADDVPMERVRNCGVVEITVKRMTGRHERARERTLCRWDF